MPKNMSVNTTESVAKNTEKKTSRPVAETLEQGIGNIQKVFRSARKMDIRIAPVDGADRIGNTVEGGVNGYMFALKRGVDIPNVPEPIIEVLKNAGIEFAMLSAWKAA
jgi:hypothetical protein